MTSEVTALAVLVLLQMLFGLVATAFIGQKTGVGWLLGSRGSQPDYRAGLAGRMERARNNGFEALILFGATVYIVSSSGSASVLTANAAWTFVVVRFVYIFCYAADLVPWRTIVWFVGWVAIMVMLGAAVMAQ